MAESREFFSDEPKKENIKMVRAMSKRSNDEAPPLDEEAIAKRRHQPIENYYRVKGAHLGHGKYSVVKPAIEKSTDKEWAVKIIEKRRVRNPLDLEREIIILQNLNHPHINCVLEASCLIGLLNVSFTQRRMPRIYFMKY